MNYTVKCWLFTVFLISVLTRQGLAQTLTLNTTNLNSNHGLSQNSIQCILKDKFGFMWFGTQDGLNRYDGFKFTVYKHSKSNPNSLPANLINTVCEDADGNVWVGTRLGGISRYDREHDCFVNYSNKPGDANSLSDDTPIVVYSDRRGNLWVGTSNGLNLFDKKTGKFKRYFNSATDSTTLSSSKINILLEDSNNNLWVGTSHGLNLLDRKTGKCQRFIDNKKRLTGNNNAIWALVEDEQHQIWVGTKRGLNLLNKTTRTFEYYAIDPDKNLEGNINSIYCVAKAPGNKFWIGSNTTLQLFDAGKKKLIPLNNKTNGEDIMPDDGISALLEDNAGILWIGTTSEGLVKFDRNLSVFSSYMSSPNGNPSSKNIIRGMSEDKKGNLYLATDIGVAYFNRAKDLYTFYRHSGKDKNSLASDYTLTALASKKTDDVYIGTYASGVDCFNPTTGVFRHIPQGNGPGQLSGSGVYALLEDKSGKIWMAPENGGVYVYNPFAKTFTHYQYNEKHPGGLCDNTIQAFFEDSRGNMWIGGYSNGLSIYNPAKKSFTNLNTANSGLSNNVISSFYEDKHGKMWIGTMEGGLNAYDYNSGKIIAVNAVNNRINNTINYIVGDDRGFLWLSTIQGIVRFNPVDLSYKQYGYYNGIKSLEFNLGAGTTLHTGEVAFGSINGFDIIKPDSLSFDDNKPAVAITGFELFNKSEANGKQYAAFSENISTASQIKLDYNHSNFSINFAALDYSIPQNNRYAYRLDGFDNEWHYVGNSRTATYTNLDPGNYTFRVKAANADGIWGNKEATLKITIVPPFWMTWWFRLLGLVAVFGAYYGFYLYRVNFINKQKEELENQVSIRTLEIGQQAAHLQVLNTELKQQKEELTLKSADLKEKKNSLELLNDELINQKAQEQQARLLAEKAKLAADKANSAKSTFLATMSHEIRTPMNGVLGMAALLADTNLDAEQRDYTSSIITSGKSLLLVINDVLDFSKIESGNLRLDPHEFNLRLCVKDIVELFAFKATETGIALNYQIDESLPQKLIADSLRLRQILTNLIGNAIKFTHKGAININITPRHLDNGELELCFEIRDTGIGISQNQLGQLFQPFNQVDSSITRKYGGTGLGLVICQRLVKLMGGTITVQSTYGVGSTFSFCINCKTEPQKEVYHKIEKEKEQTAVPDKQMLSNDFAAAFPLSILVAEDNLMNQKLIMRVLNKLGYQPDLANDGLEAVNMLEEKNYDLVLMDIQMPKMDGLEATRVIRKRFGASPLIAAMTANALSEDMDSCFEAGMNDYMSKPINIELLKTKLMELHGAVLSVNNIFSPSSLKEK